MTTEAIHLGNYYIKETYQEDGRVIILRCQRKSDHRNTLVKLARSNPPIPEEIERLEHEYQISKGINLPSVLGIYGFEVISGRPALLLEDIGGVSLDRLIISGGLDLQVFLKLSCQIAGALVEIHSHRLVHKDIKPQNIIVNILTDELKITGFELASYVTHQSSTKASAAGGLVMGSLAYMSPEETGHGNRAIDQRTDLYSTGITLYHMLTGQLPFEASDVLGWVHCHVAKMATPPHELVPNIPKPVSDIVMKLMAKSGEDRYQSAIGLKSDLEKCLARLTKNNQVESFTLAENDFSSQLRLSKKLYGRNEEQEKLRLAFDRVRTQKATEVVLLSGPSGSGKTTLATQLLSPALEAGGFFVVGKSKQHLNESVPFSLIGEVCQSLVNALLTESPDVLKSWRQRLLDILDNLEPILVDQFPAIAQIIGQERQLTEISTTNAQTVFQRVFGKFLSVFAQDGRPLVLFLDDLHRADASSLKLLQYLAVDFGLPNLLILGTYRSNELISPHPLEGVLNAMRDNNIPVEVLNLDHLPLEALSQLVADSLNRTPSDVQELARLIEKKTGGNPFFATQFLLALNAEKLIFVNQQKGAWDWDIEEISKKDFTDNVADFVLAEMRTLNSVSQELLKLSACVGDVIEFDTLSILHGNSIEGTRLDLAEVIRKEILLASPNSLRFSHDRIRQAAYLLIPKDEVAKTHLTIFRTLLAIQAARLEENIFTLVSHVEFCGSLLVDPEEMLEVAKLCLAAGKRAKTANDYNAAIKYSLQGIALLPIDAWSKSYQLSYELRLLLSECKCKNGEFSDAESLLNDLSNQVKGKVEKLSILRTQGLVYLATGETERANETVVACLALFDASIPLAPTPQDMRLAYESVLKELEGKKVEDLISLPRMTDPERVELMGALHMPIGMISDIGLQFVTTCHMLRTTLVYGYSEGCAPVFMMFAIVIAAVFDDFETAWKFGRLACEVMEKYNLVASRAKLYFGFGDILNYWFHHIRENVKYLDLAFKAGVESGDITFACNCCFHLITTLIAKGQPLSEVSTELARCTEFVQKAKSGPVMDGMIIVRQSVRNLMGQTHEFSTFDDDSFHAESFEEHLRKDSWPFFLFMYYFLRVEASFLARNYEAAIALSAQVEGLKWSAPIHVQIPEYYYFHSLSLSRLYSQLDESKKLDYLNKIIEYQETFRIWSGRCPENFYHKYALISAELCRIRKQGLEAIQWYQKAVRSAYENEYVQNAGIGCELAAQHYLELGLETEGHAYLREARLCFARWQADGKVAQLDRLYPFLAEASHVSSAGTFVSKTDQIGVMSVVKASQYISEKLSISQLRETLMRLVVEYAGAKVGYFILVQDDLFLIHAEASVVEGKIVFQSYQNDRKEIGSGTLASVVRYVWRKKQSVMTDDPASAGLLQSEEFMHERGFNKSVFCFPILREGQTRAVIYLENELMSGAFTQNKKEIIEVLASQAVISFENAELYDSLEKSRDKLQSIVDNSTALISVKGVDGKYILINRRFEELFHVSKNDIGSKTDFDVFTKEMAGIYQQNDRKVLESRQSVLYEEEAVQEDEIHTYVSVKFPLLDASGAIYAVGNISTDITERKRREESDRFLGYTSEKLSEALDYEITCQTVVRLPIRHLADWCFFYRFQGNESTTPSILVGHSDHEKADLVDMRLGGEVKPLSSICQGIVSDERVLSVGNVLLITKVPELLQTVRNQVDPRFSDVLEEIGVHSALLIPLYARGKQIGELLLCASRPDRKLSRSEVSLAEEFVDRCTIAIDNSMLYQESQRAIKVREEFLAIASHELRTPLTPLRIQIQTLSRLVQNKNLLTHLPDGIANSFERVMRGSEDQIERLTNLVENLLDVSRLSIGRLELTIGPVDLSELVRNIVVQYQSELKRLQCSVECDVPPLVMGYWDRTRIEQVVTNLLSNAMKYGKGKPIHISLRSESENAILQIRDYGVGIAQEHQIRIFKRFERVNSIWEEGGMGLGLYITQQIVLAHHGLISVRSEPGKGSTFAVQLPKKSVNNLPIESGEGDGT